MRRRKIKKVKFPCEICGTVTFLHEHHIKGRDVPNPHHHSNLVSVCPNCHNELHHGEIIIEGWLQTTGGKELFWHKKGEESFTGDDAKVHIFGEKKDSGTSEPI